MASQQRPAAEQPRRKPPVALLAGAAAGLALVLAAVVAVVLLSRGRGVPVDEGHFPDPALRAWVEEVADADVDGRVTEVEARRVVVVECERVADITGLDNFANVEELRLAGSGLEEVEISGYESLRVVDLSGSESLETVRLDDLPALDELYLEDTGALHVYLQNSREPSKKKLPDGTLVHYEDGQDAPRGGAEEPEDPETEVITWLVPISYRQTSKSPTEEYEWITKAVYDDDDRLVHMDYVSPVFIDSSEFTGTADYYYDKQNRLEKDRY